MPASPGPVWVFVPGLADAANFGNELVASLGLGRQCGDGGLADISSDGDEFVEAGEEGVGRGHVVEEGAGGTAVRVSRLGEYIWIPGTW